MPEHATEPGEQVTITVDLGVFAHNEAAGISATIEDLARQSIRDMPGITFRVLVLANGCTDDTADVAQRAAREAGAGDDFEVVVLERGGKSRTWNRFVHDLSRKKSDVLLFCDADIRLPDEEALEKLVATLMEGPKLRAVSSRPVKDLQHDGADLGLQERLIAASGGGLDDWRRAICGQLYAMRAQSARSFHLPVGLPVEDGFVRAAVLTDVFSGPEDVSRIDGADTFHVYGSERTIRGLLRHQCRIVMGGAVNLTVFERLAMLEPHAIPTALAQAADEEDWLATTVRAATPRWPYGWVPMHFMIKRLHAFRSADGTRKGIRSVAILTVGLVFDTIVYILVQLRMARGQGAGFW